MRDNQTGIYVIIPVYNCKKYIKTAVDSVISQPYKKIEIVIVDDGSTDGTSQICDRMAENNKQIHVIHKINAGVSEARNTGMEYVYRNCINKGKKQYIAFLDADDAWVKNSIDEKVEKLFLCEYDLIGFQSCNCSENMKYRAVSQKLREGIYTGGNEAIWLFSEQHFAAMFFNIYFLRKYDFAFRKIKYSEDKIFSMECMYLAESICLRNKPFYLYRNNPISAVHTRTFGISYFLPIIENYLQLNQDMKRWENGKRGEFREGKILARWYLMDMIEEHYQHGGNREEIQEIFYHNKQYVDLLNDECVGGKHITERWKKIQQNHCRVYMKNQIYGFVYKQYKLLMNSKMLSKYIERRKYPIRLGE